MILADTSVWIDFLRGGDAEMQRLIQSGQIVIHPCITAELALGSLQNRQKTLALLDMLSSVQVAQLGEVRSMIETHALFSRGIGLIDAHLIAACLLTPGIQLWTRDASLKRVAQSLRIAANLP